MPGPDTSVEIGCARPSAWRYRLCWLLKFELREGNLFGSNESARLGQRPPVGPGTPCPAPVRRFRPRQRQAHRARSTGPSASRSNRSTRCGSSARSRAMVALAAPGWPPAQRSWASAVLPGNLRREVGHQRRDVVHALAQGRQQEREDIDAVVQIRPEAAAATNLSRSRWVATITRTSTGTERSPPTRSTWRSSSTRSSLACIAIGMSPISSRKRVPRWPARTCRCAARPHR